MLKTENEYESVVYEMESFEAKSIEYKAATVMNISALDVKSCHNRLGA